MSRREHIVVEPSAEGSIDFRRRAFDTSLIWLQFPKANNITSLLPPAIAEASSGADLTFSSFRRLPMCDPDDFGLSNEPGCLTRIYMRLGGSWPPDMWTSLYYYDPRRPPVLGDEKFYASSGGLKRLLSETLEKPNFIDSLRRLDNRPKIEVWVRNSLRAMDIAPDAIDMPKWMKAVEGLSPEQASAAMAAIRAPTSNAEWYQIRARDKAERERAKQPEPETPVQPTEPATATEAAPPTVLTMEEKRTLTKRRERLHKVTQSKVQADKKDAIEAKRHSDRVISKMQRAGQL